MLASKLRVYPSPPAHVLLLSIRNIRKIHISGLASKDSLFQWLELSTDSIQYNLKCEVVKTPSLTGKY